ncbi:hypothetical protein PV797_16990 [Clostridiaceae bacterium M8S5]|nr:hypothetical protein PV797_16990 [Clostridiaceae bacterium M8S5]
MKKLKRKHLKGKISMFIESCTPCYCTSKDNKFSEFIHPYY